MAAQGVDTDSVRGSVDGAGDSADGSDELYGFAVAVVYDDGRWSCTPMGDEARESLDAAVAELRGMRAAGPVFGLLDVDESFFAIVRPGPETVHLALSDAVCAIDYDLAADILEVLGVDVPDLTPDEVDDADPWPEGDLAVLADLGLPEPVLSVIMDEVDLYPDEQLGTIAQNLGFADEFAAVLDRIDR
ncbi:tRNA adenosine deaminase-associated protein [Tomitella gaofuii]|uniref:tRNA adenosine deaminase-associated protein n=1 Tax=Tomitella gaofuii TaxID=2760083 RepID=UPI0015FB6D27|nr:tRNA adenosine deaminase-associated protein [Tomitella gaofuii]